MESHNLKLKAYNPHPTPQNLSATVGRPTYGKQATDNLQPITYNPQMATLLPFDSELFDYPVGKVEVTDHWNEEHFLEESKAFKLVYLFSKKPIEIEDARIRWVDTKVVFEKKLEPGRNSSEIHLFKNKNIDSRLEQLALQSGVYSRFKTDARLKNKEFEKLYSLWIKKAFEKDKILCDQKCSGMITLSKSSPKASIVLFAVAESSRGLGLGTKLIRAAEYEAQNQGAKSLSIPTQLANVPACKLYDKLGYQEAEKIYIYHFWNEDV